MLLKLCDTAVDAINSKQVSKIDKELTVIRAFTSMFTVANRKNIAKEPQLLEKYLSLFTAKDIEKDEAAFQVQEVALKSVNAALFNGLAYGKASALDALFMAYDNSNQVALSMLNFRQHCI